MSAGTPTGAPPDRLRAIGTLGLLDLRLLLSDRSAVFWMLILPLFLMWIFGTFAGSSEREEPAVAVGVVVEDRGVFGQALVDAIAGEDVQVTRLEPAALDSARQEMRALEIPSDFSAKVLAREQVALRLMRREGGHADYDRAAEVRIWKAIVRLLGNTIVLDKESADAAGGDNALASLPDLAGRYASVAARPPRIAVRSEVAGHGHPVPSGFAQSVPGTLTMSILMMTVIYGAIFLTFEKTEGMLRRQGSLPIERRVLLAGKLLGRLMIAFVQVIILLVAGYFLFHVNFGRSPAGLALIVVAFTAAAAATGLLFGALYRTPEQAGSTGWIAPLVMAAMGGCWWPLEVVPGWMRTAGHLFPTAWAMDAFHSLVSFGEGVGAVWPEALILLGYTVVVTALAVRFLRWD